MTEVQELKPEELKTTCNHEDFDFETTEDIEPLEGIIGQERARRAMEFGVRVEKQGYNIYVAGLNGTGRNTYTQSIIGLIAKEKPVPSDWCYVYNFEYPDQPIAISMPTGIGSQFKEDMDKLNQELKVQIPKTFSGEEYNKRKTKILQQFQEESAKLMEELNETAKEYGFIFKRSVNGFVSIPLIDGKPVNEEQYRNLDEETLSEIEKKNEQLQMITVEIFNKIKELEHKTQETLKQLDEEVGMNAVGYLIKQMKQKYEQYKCEEILKHLDRVQKDIIENVADFKETEEDSGDVNIAWLTKAKKTDHTLKYRVNLLIDSNKLKHAPVIIENNPTYYNLVGKVEYENQLGVLTTNFTKIKPGALHRANGGYLIIQAKDVLTNPFAWEALKRALKTRQVTIENIGEYVGHVATSTLKPKPISLSVKVVMIGNYYIHQLLYNLDEDYKKLFKIKADFDIEMNKNDDHMYKIASFISKRCKNDGLKHFHKSAVARVVEYSSRLAERQNKLSARFNEMVEIIDEADAWARMEAAEYVMAEHVTKAIKEKIYRSNKYEKKIQEYIKEGTILIDTEGAVVGQVNGLSVLDMGEYSFGRPSRITVATYAGRKGIINIEREAKMSGSIHDKGVLILSGYLGRRFAQESPLSLTASIAFEQSYGGIDGDSASSTELYSILSSLSGIPIKQNIAVTGSVNQKGEIQPIGGANQKIEGFFRVCKERGFTGNQGVMIPHQNVDNLMLDDEVIEAVQEGKFHIYPVKTIEEGIEILTGVPAGVPNEEGNYPEETVYRKVKEKLDVFRKIVEKSEEDKEEKFKHN